MAAKRRGRGEGSIYRRKDGRWVGQYEVGGKRRYVYGETRKDVAAKLAKAVADRSEGLVFDSDHLTVGQYLDRWMDSIGGTVRESTWVRHENALWVLATTGIRIGEALGLRWDEILQMEYTDILCLVDVNKPATR